MKHIITCICLMLVTGMMAQTTPTTTSKTGKMSVKNARAAISKTSLGVTDGPAANSIAKGNFGVQVTPVDGGVEIKEFTYVNSTAKAAKLKTGDIITAINSKKITNQAEFKNALEAFTPGDVVVVHYNRGTRKLTKDVRVGRK